MAIPALIAYYSRGGANYVNGNIVNLATGNTQVVAETLASLTGAELFRIVPVKDYSSDYDICVAQTQKDLADGIKPELTGHPTQLAPEGVILLGFPTYWGTPPMPVMSFLQQVNMNGRIILPFCTHEGSEFGHSLDNIRAACPDAEVLEGLAIRGGRVKTCTPQLVDWLTRNGVPLVSGSSPG